MPILTEPLGKEQPHTEHDRRTVYRMAMCDAMALALHELTSLPLGLFRAYYPDPDGNEGEEAHQDCHAVVILDPQTPRWLDVDGIQSAIPVERLTLDPLGDSVRWELVPATSEEVAEAFTVEGVSEHDIARARDFIGQDHILATAVNEVISARSDGSRIRECTPHSAASRTESRAVPPRASTIRSVNTPTLPDLAPQSLGSPPGKELP
jgi:hypothetical protein